MNKPAQNMSTELRVNGKPAGYLYVVLLSEEHDRYAERGATSAALNTALLSIALVGGYGFFIWFMQMLIGPPGPPS